MNVELDSTQLQAFDHLNRAQQRAFILRDQLKYTEPRYLDMFINGIANPEPPVYKYVGGEVQPRLEQVTIKEDAKSFDLGNVEFKNKQVKRIILNVVNDEYNIDADAPLPPDPRNIQTVPINYLVAQNTFPQVKAKYEAIHDRVQAINKLRKHMFDEARSKPQKQQARFKEGKSYTQLINSFEEDGTQVLDPDSRKRPGEFISRHQLNKKKRIGIDHISEKIKTDAVNGLPDQTKVDLFNAFVRSAFPDFDNLLMASWNVVSIYVNVGSENEMLHNSIGDLHEVLMKFDELLGKSKRARPSTSRTDARNDERHSLTRNAPTTPGHSTLNDHRHSLVHHAPGTPGPNTLNDHRHSLTQNTPGNARLSTLNMGAMPHIPASDRLVELPSDDRDNTREAGPTDNPPKRPNSLRLPPSSRQIDRPPSISPGQTPSRRPEVPSQSSTNTHTPARPTGRPLPQSHADLFKNKDPRFETTSVIDQGYAYAQAQKKQQRQEQHAPSQPAPAPASQPQPPQENNASAPKSSRTTTRPSPPSTSQPSSQASASNNPSPSQRRYGMFNEGPVRSTASSSKDLDSLFVEDDDEDDEAVQTPGMQEVHEQDEAAQAQKPLSLGNSLLGRSLKERKGAGGAPVAVMVPMEGGRRV